MKERTYLCIDLKSFYASVECRERGLDPMTTNLVVADSERSEKTICLAVSPAMKRLGVPGRCRLFEIPKGIDYIIATPRMQLYIDYSAEIYGVYLKYISKDDIHVYSIDEVFMDVTDYLGLYQMSAKQLALKIMSDVFTTTGITATCGIGNNLYLSKIALDITAKHSEEHIGILNEETYRKTLWNHKPLTDFWRVGKGIAKRLEQSGMTTMWDIAHANEDTLYQMFGIDAELLIDHAWGREPVTMADIKAYKSKKHSVGSGQVLSRDYSFEEGKLITGEMADLLCLELVEKGLITDSLTLHVGYAKQYGLKSAHGTIGLPIMTSSAKYIMEYAKRLYERIVLPDKKIRRVTLSYNDVQEEVYQQYDLFTDQKALEREHQMQKAMLEIKDRYGKNAIVKGMNLQESATTMERNMQIGGHKSGAT